MALDPENNPMSFPILKYFDRSPSLIHALQSVGAAHQNFFNPNKMNRCLEERTLAMQHVRKELNAPTKDPSLLFLTVFLLGLSSFWTAGPGQDPVSLYHAQAHLLGGRALIDNILALPATDLNQQMYFAFGAYLYWDMACAFIIESGKQVPLSTPEVFAAVQVLGNTYHPILGYSAEITYLLANLGRYCRAVADTGERDFPLEAVFEEQLEQWEPNRESPELGLLGDAYRYHGLINLYVIRRQTTAKTASPQGCSEETRESLATGEPVREAPCLGELSLDDSNPAEFNLADSNLWDPSLWESSIWEPSLWAPSLEDPIFNEPSFEDLNLEDPSREKPSFEESGLGKLTLCEPNIGKSYEGAETNNLDWIDFLPLDISLSPSPPSFDGQPDGFAVETSPTAPSSTDGESEDDLDATIRRLAIQAVTALTQVPETHPCINLHGIPLLTAGSELAAEDKHERDLVTKRFRALYSLNHLPANLAALELLNELWAKRDAGEVTSWLTLMREKGWELMLG